MSFLSKQSFTEVNKIYINLIVSTYIRNFLFRKFSSYTIPRDNIITKMLPVLFTKPVIE